MKKLSLFVFLLSILKINAQITTRNDVDGSIVITPKGLQGKTNTASNYTCVALGNLALFSNTAGVYNTAIGLSALNRNLFGNNNTASGYLALSYNIEGDDNTATGARSLESNTFGNGNTASGFRALFSNTYGSANTASGSYSLHANTTGVYNTAHGFESLYMNTEGKFNTAVGKGTLFNNSTGEYNTAIGVQAGYDNVGSYNTFVGYDANITGNFINATAIGYNAQVNDHNKVRIGNSAVTVIEGQVAWSNPSDRRLKENINYTNRLGLDFINRLQTVSYNYTSDKNKTRYDGFIAQDIEQVMKDLGVPFSGLKKSDDGMYSLAYSDFVMPLVNAVKELKQKNESLEKQVEKLEKQNALLTQLAQRVAALEEIRAESVARETGKK